MDSNAYYITSKPHALDKAVTPTGVFPSAPQTVTYTGFDKVLKVKQGGDSLVYGYSHDRQRIAMEEHVGNTVRTKRYVGNCEYVTETTGNATVSHSLTYLTGPFGVFAVVEKRNGESTLHYVQKDHLGSWTAVTASDGTLEQRLSYDAWGNLRDPNTWSGSYTGTPMFDRGFTGHEHLTSFGLINMNGRMYDPTMSSFLSVDRYIQDPTSAQGFNRYAYCLYNPLRYVDPTGWYVGAPVSRSGLIRDYLSDPCYITRQQLREAGMYDIEGGYSWSGGQGSMNAGWMESDGQLHTSEWGLTTSSGGFEAGAWAIPASFNAMWINYCLGYCDYGYSDYENNSFHINMNTNPSSGCGNGGGSVVGRILLNNPIIKDVNSVIGYIASSESVLFGARSNSLLRPNNMKIKNELGKTLKSTYEARGIVPKGSSAMKVGEKAAFRLSEASDILGCVGIAFVGVDIYLNDGIVYPSHLLDIGVGTASIVIGPYGWIVGASYLAVDVGSYAFTGHSFGHHLNDWCGWYGYDLKTGEITP